MDFIQILGISVAIILASILLLVIILYTRWELLKIKDLAERKGYDGNAWVREYMFGIFTTPQRVLLELEALPDRNKNKENTPDPYIPEDKNSWKCGCGIVNPSYTGTCSCGRTKDDPNAVQDNDDNFEKIREYKKLLDDGIITEDEFEQKKSELLKL